MNSQLLYPSSPYSLGPLIYYVTITLESKGYPILMASFDIETDHENIIMNKILPMINDEGL